MLARAAWILPLLAVAPAALAQRGPECRANPHLSRARELFDELDYLPAAQTLARAIEFSGNCQWALGQIYQLKGVIHAIDHEDERCLRSMTIALALGMDLSLPAETTPRLVRCVEAAQALPREQRQILLSHHLPARIRPLEPLAVEVRLEDPLRLVDRVQVWFRRLGMEQFTLVSVAVPIKVDPPTIVIPGLALPDVGQSYTIEYLVRAVDRWDGILVEQGTAKAPLKLTVAPE